MGVRFGFLTFAICVAPSGADSPASETGCSQDGCQPNRGSYEPGVLVPASNLTEKWRFK